MDKRLQTLIRAGIASGSQLAGADPASIIAEKQRKARTFRAVAEEPQVLEGRRIRYVWSTETVDRMGDIVRQSWDLSGYSRNPMALWSHNHDVPLGNAVEYGLASAPRRQLAGVVEYAPEGIDPFIDSRYKLAAAGYLRTVSVGFMPHEIDPVTDKEERAKLGLGQWGVVFERNELLEISLVTVPANPDAVEDDMREFVQRGVLTTDEAEVYVRSSSPMTERDWAKRLGSESQADPEPAGPSLVDLMETLGDLRDDVARLAERLKYTTASGDVVPDPFEGLDDAGRAAEIRQLVADFANRVSQPREKAKQ